MRKLQIGVIGSMADLNYSKSLEEIAERVGELIAERNGVLLFGAEKDADSLSARACLGAKRNNGLTIGITYGTSKESFQDNVDVIIPTGLERGGGREFVLMLGCDAVIVLSGGSGTLGEMTMAYQANIPIIAIKGLGGWGDKLADQYIDDRQRRKVIGVETAEEAVEAAFREATK